MTTCEAAAVWTALFTAIATLWGVHFKTYLLINKKLDACERDRHKLWQVLHTMYTTRQAHTCGDNSTCPLNNDNLQSEIESHLFQLRERQQ